MKKIYQCDLAEDILQEIEKVNFGKDRQIIPIISEEIVKQIKAQSIFLDIRAKLTPQNGIASVFDGLDFDPDNIRSQAFSIYEKDIPISIMTMIIAPKIWIKDQKYFKKSNSDIKVIDATQVINSETTPDFYVIPAWTKVADSHLTKLALPGYRAFNNIINKIQKSAPQNTYIEMTAQGNLDNSKWSEVKKYLDQLPLNTSIPKEIFPFDISQIGTNNPGSNSTVKLAKLMGLHTAENIGAGNSLGPVFFKKLN